LTAETQCSRAATKLETDISPRSSRRSQRSEAATEFRIISRKDAKAAKRKKYLSELNVLGTLAGGISESKMFRILANLLKPRNFSSIVVRSEKNIRILRGLSALRGGIVSNFSLSERPPWLSTFETLKTLKSK